MENNNLTKGARVAGTIVYGVVQVIIQTYGLEGYINVLKRMTPEHKSLLESTHSASRSFTSEFTRDYLDAITRALPSKSSQSVITEIVRELAHNHLSTVMTIFLKLGTPHFILQRFPNIWRLFFTHGTMVVENEFEKSADVMLLDNIDYGEGVCMGSLGWMQGAMEKSGAKDVIVIHPKCIFRGDTKCIFKFAWS